MLSTGIRTDVGIKIYGASLDTINVLAQKIKKTLEGTSGVKDLYAEPITGGKYIDIEAKRDVIGRYGLTIDDINNVVEASIGGMKTHHDYRRKTAFFSQCTICTRIQK